MSARSLAPGWAAAHLQRHWPGLDSVPDGRDLFDAHPVYIPRAERLVLHPTKPRGCHQCSGYGTVIDSDGKTKTCPTCLGTGEG